jgi:hypothetical protein
VDHPSTSTGDWPAVPPAPAPMRPVAAPPGPEPPIINTDVRLITGTAMAEAEAPTAVVGSVPVTAIPAAPIGTARVPVSPLPPAAPFGIVRRPPRPLPPPPVPIQAATEVPTGPVDRLSAELIWQPRFAIASAAVILVALTVVTMPLWIVLYRLVGTTGAATADILALGMMLLGAFLAAAAAWVVVIEMRARVRMVDTMARDADRERLHQPTAPVVAMLTVALALFAGATVLSLH